MSANRATLCLLIALLWLANAGPLAALPIEEAVGEYAKFRANQERGRTGALDAKLSAELDRAGQTAALRRHVEQAKRHLADGNELFAIGVLSRAVLREPDAPGIRLSLARLYNQTGRYERALSMGRGLRERFPSRFEAHEILGTAHLALGDADAAVQSYRAFVAGTPELALAHYLLGNALLRAEDEEGALASFGRALKLDPELAGAAVASAVLLEKRARHAEAIERSEQALRVTPDDAFARLILAEALRANGEVARAEAEYRRAVELQPRFPVFSLRLADLLESTQRSAEAREVLETLLAEVPDAAAHEALAELHAEEDDEAWQGPYHHGMASQLRGEGDAAVRQLRAALERAPENADVRYALARAELQARRTQEAAKLLADAPSDVEVQLLRAQIALAERDTAGAERALRDALSIDGTALDARLMLAGLLLRARRYDEAIEGYRAALERAPERADLYEALGDCHLASKQLAKAQQAYLDALLRTSDHSDLVRKLAGLYVRSGKASEEGLFLAREAVALTPNDARNVFTLGRAFELAGKPERARNSFRAALKLRPTEPSILYRLAVVEHALGDPSAARAALEKALGLGSAFPDATAARALLDELDATHTPLPSGVAAEE